MLAKEYKLINISLINCSPGWTNKAGRQHNIILINYTHLRFGLTNHGISAHQKALTVSGNFKLMQQLIKNYLIMSTTYHSNGRVKWSLGSAYHENGRTAFSLGTAYHENGRTAFSLGTAYHDNGRTALSLGTAYHSNGRTAFSLGTAYHSNGRTAFSLGTFYDENGRVVDNKSFSIGLGRGIQMQIIPTIKITVYGRKIN
ncbi:MAG TPA: YadA-like family protein [Cytophagales bacterium]|nr:YadA-like family protein [Cytophagales bacterium]